MRRDRACVLIVEDNADWKGVLREALELFGYRVLEGDTAHSAIQTATAERPDLILLDLRLPDMDGTVAARVLKKRMETAHIPINRLQRLFRRRVERQGFPIGDD